jgi:hypothetical protein
MKPTKDEIVAAIIPRVAATQALVIEMLAGSGAAPEIIARAREQLGRFAADPATQEIGLAALRNIDEIGAQLAARRSR